MSGGMIKTDTSGLADIVMDTKGDMVDYDTARQRLPIGSTSDVLTVTAGGLPAWVAPASAGATVTTVSTLLSTTFTTTSNTATVLTGLRLTLPTISGGKCLVVCSGIWTRSTSGGANGQLYTDATGSDAQIYGTMRASEFEVDVVVPQFCFSSNCIHDASGDDISVYVWTGGGTQECLGSGSSGKSWTMSTIGVG